ncbi:MAG: aminoacyl-tRNA hydrolase [Myxococcota bacterium]|nr:aminoacyl-tRNA hydrolase [Myxococcota bacterium]
MWLVVGLGNPGAKYAQTRHNIGFMVVDRLAERAGGKLGTKKFSAQFGRESIAGRSVVLSKPQTFMNNSGDSVQPMAAFFKVPSARVLIIHDELDLSFGLVRIKQSGGHAGHNGLRSISSRWGGGDYPRVRIGIGRPSSGGDVTGHVLGRFSADEDRDVQAVVERACDAVEAVLRDGVVAAMNTVNAAGPIAGR